MDTLGSIIRNVPFSPAITGSLLFALTKAPAEYRLVLLKKLRETLSDRTIAHGIKTLKYLFALGLARNVHVFLSNVAQNNFRLRSERHRYDWPNELAVVTGAASGFGALISRDLAAKGLNVIAVDIRDELPEDMQKNSNIFYYKCDVSNRQAVFDLAQKVREEHGKDPSILVNNAGVAYEHSVLDASEAALRRTYDVNIISHYFTLQAFVPAMIREKKGHIVSTASMASFLSAPGLVPYCNTKAAVLSLHDGLIQETRVTYKTPEIKFTIVHPTFAATPLIEPFSQQLKTSRIFVLNPQVVSDAVVDQILACKGRQIVLNGNMGWITSIRAWPHWISQALLQSMDGSMELAQVGSETSSHKY